MIRDKCQLQGHCVWVTRPAGQADKLIELLEQAGAKAVHFPVIEISDIDGFQQQAEKLENISHCAAVIFVSRNAVSYAYKLQPGLFDNLKSSTVLAVGAGTRAALLEHGLSQVDIAPDGAGSEAILQLPALDPQRVRGKKIIIVRGQGGREKLKQSLISAGADVIYAEVYTRRQPVLQPLQAKKVWQDRRPDVIVVTSVEGLNNLSNLIHPDELAELFNTTLVVISTRMQIEAKTLGFIAGVYVAECASDEGLMKTVVRSFEMNKE